MTNELRSDEAGISFFSTRSAVGRRAARSNGTLARSQRRGSATSDADSTQRSSASTCTRLRSRTLVDFQIAADLKEFRTCTAIEGTMPEALSRVEDASLDVVICVSVLEHMWDDAALLQECRRVLAPGGVLYVHVPSWHGKRLLEISTFRFGISADEMDDHKRYYNPTDLWRLLRTAGFMPHVITCRYHQLGCSTYAVCRPD